MGSQRLVLLVGVVTLSLWWQQSFPGLTEQQGGTELQCNSADPLLAAVLRMESSDRPTGLLLVVEPGFNSARALEEARLLISQMGSVQDVGVVLIGAPLPE